MANQWQFGVYGHAEDAGDEIARKCIIAVQRDLGCSASAAIKYICAAYAHGIQPVTYVQDNSDVVALIRAGFDDLRRRIDNVGVTHDMYREAPPASGGDDIQAFKVVNSITGEESTVDVERVPVDINSVFAEKVRKAARPGMRLES